MGHREHIHALLDLHTSKDALLGNKWAKLSYSHFELSFFGKLMQIIPVAVEAKANISRLLAVSPLKKQALNSVQSYYLHSSA